MTSNQTARDLFRKSEQSGHRHEIVSRLKALAEDGDASASSMLASIFGEGLEDKRGREVVRPNPRLAKRYEAEAAKRGDPESMTSVADRLLRTKRFASAKTLYERAAKQGYSTASYNLACAYQNRGEYSKAVLWFRRALKQGDSSALLPLARAELYGLGTPRNVRTGITKLQRLAASEDEYSPNHWLQCEAMLVLADAFINGWPVPRDYTKGIGWLTRAAGYGNQPALALLEYYEGTEGKLAASG